MHVSVQELFIVLIMLVNILVMNKVILAKDKLEINYKYNVCTVNNQLKKDRYFGAIFGNNII